jgi:hypothetical protein
MTMFRKLTVASTLAGSLLVAALGVSGSAGAAGLPPNPRFTNPTTISNPYLPITKFQRCVLGGNDQGQHLRIERTLLKQTQPFTYAGQTFQAVRVFDRVKDLKAGVRIERTVDYFAQDDAGNVYYLGEDVNEYNKHGKLISHEGQWRLGRDTQVPGILMPAQPKVGDVFDSESVPGIVHETSTIEAIGGTARVGGHSYSNVLRIREDARPPPEVEFTRYAPGIGVISEANGGVSLIRCR